MKKLLFSIFIISLAAVACNKEATCTCKNKAGTVISTSTSKGTKSKVEDFKEKCNNTKNVETWGSTSYTTPCEVS